MTVVPAPPLRHDDDLGPVAFAAHVQTARGVVTVAHPSVGPPSVGVALAVLSGDVARARTALRPWLPVRLASALAPLDDASLVRAMVGLLDAFTTSRPPAPPAGIPDADGIREATLRSTRDGVHDLAVALGVLPDVVLAMPWPLFLATVEARGRARTERLLDEALAARAAEYGAEAWRAFVAECGRTITPGPAGTRVERTDEERAAEEAEAAEWRAGMRGWMDERRARRAAATA